MLQIISISEARKNIAKIADEIEKTKRPVIILRESKPTIILYPYLKELISTGQDENSTYIQKLSDIKGDWFSSKEYKMIRKQVEKRLRNKKRHAKNTD